MGRQARSRQHLVAMPSVWPRAILASAALHVGGALGVAAMIGGSRFVRPQPAWIAIQPHARTAPTVEPVEIVEVTDLEELALPKPGEVSEITELEERTDLEQPTPDEERFGNTPPSPPLRPLASLLSPRATSPSMAMRVSPEADPVVDELPSSSAVVDPRPLTSDNQPPTYPELALQRHSEGTVVVLLELGADGTVKATRVLRSSGRRLLDQAATTALARWRFAPARRGGIAVPSSFRQTVVFRIPGG